MPAPNRRQRLADGGSAIVDALIGYFSNWVPAAILMLVILLAIIFLF